MSKKLDARTSELVAISRLDAQVSFDHSTVTQTIRKNPRTRTQQIWKRDHRELGRGGFAAVYLERSQGEIRAVKKLRKLSNDDYNRELAIAALFSRATRFEGSFVQSFGWYETPEEIFLTMEYLPLGDLSRYITTPLPEKEVQSIMLQIFEGLVFMHELSYVHRDLKPANILVAQCGPHWWVKIADFGISKRAGFGTELRTLAFTPGYAAPEVASVEARGRQASAYTNAVDIWSAGMLTYSALMGLASVKHANLISHNICATIDRIKDDLDTRDLSAECRDFVMQLLHSDPSARPAAVDCLNHDWLENVGENPTPVDPERPMQKQSPGPRGPLEGQESSARWSTVLGTAAQATTVPQHMPSLIEQLGISDPHTDGTLDNRNEVRSGKTRLPKRLVHREVLLTHGLSFDESDRLYVVQKALPRALIDELVEESKALSERCRQRDANDRPPVEVQANARNRFAYVEDASQSETESTIRQPAEGEAHFPAGPDEAPSAQRNGVRGNSTIAGQQSVPRDTDIRKRGRRVEREVRMERERIKDPESDSASDLEPVEAERRRMSRYYRHVAATKARIDAYVSSSQRLHYSPPRAIGCRESSTDDYWARARSRVAMKRADSMDSMHNNRGGRSGFR